MIKARVTRRKLIFAAIFAFAFIFLWTSIPRPALYDSVTFSTSVYDRDNKLLRLTLAKDQRFRLFVPLQNIAPELVQATLLYEDRHFYDHPGVNVAALARATWTTYVKKTRRMGASTITMQLARMRFGLNTRTVSGKLIQIGRAIQLERHYSKDDILEAYLNFAPYGGNIEGVGTASLIYFDKQAARLTLPEALALVVIPQNPAQRAPNRSSKLPALYEARERLLSLWLEQYPVSPAQSALMRLPLQVRHTNQLPFMAPHFVQNVLNDNTRHATGAKTTTLSLSLQQAFEQTIEHFLQRRKTDGLNNASAMLVDTRTMHVLSSVGSADFHNAAISGQVNGTTAKRSPGSTLKPFVYGLAMDKGLIHPMSLLSDAPKRFGVYTPENFDRGFMGPVLATDALVYSRNVPAIELLNRVGQDAFHQLLTDANVSQLQDAEHYGLAMVLGGNELTMEELLQLYAMLANGGNWQELVHNVQETTDTSRQLMSPESSFLVLDMLRQNPRPDALSVGTAVSRTPVAWKTGTSYAYRDAWSVGIIGPYALAVWVGNFDGSGNPSLIGRQAAAPLFFDLVDTLTSSAQVANAVDRKALSTSHFPPSSLNLRKVEMCAGTGDLPNRYCPETEKGWFIPGVSPIKVSSIYRPVQVDRSTGLRACNKQGENVAEEVFEFWPSDISRLFRQAGVSIRRPPAYSPDCPQAVMAATGIAPVITSPAPKLSYQLQPGLPQADQLPLTANTDADVSSLFWFVGNEFIAEVKRDEPLLWTPTAGVYDILVVDDLGRSDSHRYHFEVVQ
ncbi:MAG: penicillin-binding protein 1C [Gammaproteobacteria bacterium]